MLIREAAAGAVRALVFSPDGDTLATTGSDDRILLWRGSFSEPDTEVPGGPVIAFSPNGSHLLSGSPGGQLRIHELGSESARDKIIKLPGAISGIAFVGREQLVISLGQAGVACHYPTSLWLWKLLADTPPLRLPVDCRNGIRAITGFPDRRLIIWVTDNKWLYVQDITRPPARPYPIPKDCRSISLAPDGRSLAVTADWDVLLFDLEKWPGPPRVVGRHTGAVTCLAFTPDSRSLLSGGWDETVRSWDLTGARPPVTLKWPVGRVSSLAIAPDGLRAVVGGETGSLSVWDLDD